MCKHNIVVKIENGIAITYCTICGEILSTKPVEETKNQIGHVQLSVAVILEMMAQSYMVNKYAILDIPEIRTVEQSNGVVYIERGESKFLFLKLKSHHIDKFGQNIIEVDNVLFNETVFNETDLDFKEKLNIGRDGFIIFECENDETAFLYFNLKKETTL